MLAFILAAFSSLCGSCLMFGMAYLSEGRRLRRAMPCIIAAAILAAFCCGVIGASLPFGISEMLPGLIFGCGGGGLFLAMAGIGFGLMEADWRVFYTRY